MKKYLLILSLILTGQVIAKPGFVLSTPIKSHYQVNGLALCATANKTLNYLNKGSHYDSEVIHANHETHISLKKIKDTLRFICKHQSELNDPDFVQRHFDFILWTPDLAKAKQVSTNKPLLIHLPKDKILMTKYYVHQSIASLHYSAKTPYALYALPKDEEGLSIEQANAKPELTRLQYGKQAILSGVLNDKKIPVLAYVSRDNLESALLQGTVVVKLAETGHYKILNVHRNNNINYDKTKPPYEQERYWYFKEVDGIKGYGKDAEYKITVSPEVTFAGDLKQFGLGNLLMIQYLDQSGREISRLGILADTGGAFTNNLYQVDYLSGIYFGKEKYKQATRHLPDYVTAYFMVLKHR